MNVWEFRKKVRQGRQWLHCKCPLGLAMDGFEPGPACTVAAAELGLSEEYCYGVAMGFDGEDFAAAGDADWERGHRFGKRMARVVGRSDEREP